MSTHEEQIRFRQLVRRQHGVVSLEQAAAVGLSRQAVARRVAAKAWFPAGPRVYQVAEHEATPQSRAVGALLSLGPEATLVGTSAAWWWRLWDTAPARPQVAVPPDRRPRPRDDVDVTRRRIDAADRTRVSGVTVTTRSLSVLDAATDLGVVDGARIADRALLREAVTLETLRVAHRRYSGRRGAPIGAELLALADGGARSWAERELHRRLRARGITGWTPNAEVVLPGYGRALGDVVFEAEKVIVEVDGWAYHRDLRAFLRDGPRQTALAAAGWVVLRTHWYELRERADVFTARLVATLRAR